MVEYFEYTGIGHFLVANTTEIVSAQKIQKNQNCSNHPIGKLIIIISENVKTLLFIHRKRICNILYFAYYNFCNKDSSKEKSVV